MARKHVTLYYKSGKSTRHKVDLRDNGYLGQSGVVIALDTSAKVEALIGQLSPLVEGKCYAYKMPTAQYKDKDIINAPQGDTNGASGFATVTVIFDDELKTVARFTIPNCLANKDDELKAIFQALDYVDYNNTKLTVKSVLAKTVVA